MKVRNLNNTSGKSCGCGSWLTHWNKHTPLPTTLCGNVNCGNAADVGAHVKKVSGSGEHYIVPFCYTCNKISSDEEIDVWFGAPLVLASACN